MENGGDSAEKSHEATEKKLEQARKKGEIPRSVDSQALALYAGLLLFAVTVGEGSLLDFCGEIVRFFDVDFVNSSSVFSKSQGREIGALLWSAFFDIAMLFAFPATLILVFLVSQRGVVFSGEKLKIRIKRISVFENGKNKFGRRGLFEFSKSFFKLIFYSLCLALFVVKNSSKIVGSVSATPTQVVVLMMGVMLEFLTLIFFISIFVGALDYYWQLFEHKRKNRMTHKELLDEIKESEGDPYIKHQRRLRSQEIAMSQTISNTKKADVLVVNPEHYAVALLWEKEKKSAPKCVAKGVDEVALKMKEVAKKEGIAIYEDPPTARALFGTVEVGSVIDESLYEPVAAAIRYSQSLKRKV